MSVSLCEPRRPMRWLTPVKRPKRNSLFGRSSNRPSGVRALQSHLTTRTLAAESVADSGQGGAVRQTVKTSGGAHVQAHSTLDGALLCPSCQVVCRTSAGAENCQTGRQPGQNRPRGDTACAAATFATLALQKNISLAAIQKILGHDRLTTTAIYLNLTDTHVVEEYEQKW